MDKLTDITAQLDTVTGGSGSIASHVGGVGGASSAQLQATLSGLSSSITNITQNNNKGGLNDPTTMMMFALMASQRHAQTQVAAGPGFYSWRTSY